MKKTCRKLIVFIMVTVLTVAYVPVSGVSGEEAATDTATSVYGQAENEISISDGEELAAFLAEINEGNTFAGQTVKLTGDIDMKDTDWVMGGDRIDISMIGYERVQGKYYFDGTFDGQDHVIRNLSGSAEKNTVLWNKNMMALFGSVGENGIIRNLTVESAYIEGTNAVGVIASLNLGKIENCDVNNSIIVSKGYSVEDGMYFDPGDCGTGAVCAMNNGSVKNCGVSGNSITTGGAILGGVTGVNSGYIGSCTSRNLKLHNYEQDPKTDVIRWNSIGDTGGIAGCNSATFYIEGAQTPVIEYCANYSDICGIRSTGGICGFSCNAIIKDCANFGSISGQDEMYSFKPDYFGGICGTIWETDDSYPTTIVRSANYGDVCGYTRVGGIVGEADNMSGGFGAENQTKIDESGSNGLESENPGNNNTLGIRLCLNTGDVSASMNMAGGICGKTDAKITGSFNTGDVDLGGETIGSIDIYYAGGIAGVEFDGVEDCGNSGAVSCTKTGDVPTAVLAGGLIGNSPTSHIFRSYNIGAVATEVPANEWEDRHIYLGGAAGAIDPELIKDCYYTSGQGTMAVSINGIEAGGEGLPAGEMRGASARDTMPGLFPDSGGYFTVAEDYKTEDGTFSTPPFIEEANMDRTTAAVKILNNGNDKEISDFCVDVNPDDYYHDAVLWAYKNGVCSGMDKLHFDPRAEVTRAQVLTFLWRSAGCPDAGQTVSKFSDLKPDAYYAGAVSWALDRGIVKGISDKIFSPNTTCTRAQIVTILARYAGVKDDEGGYSGEFTDVSPEKYYSGAVSWAVSNNITEGIGADRFGPSLNCTRGQSITFIYRLVNK